MTAFAPRSLEYLNESTFADSTNTTMTKRIPVTSISVTPSWERIPDESIQTRQNDMRAPVLGVREADIEFTCNVPGGNADPSGTLAESWFADLLSNAIGASALLNVSEAITTGSDADTIVATSSTVAAGHMFAVGVRGVRAGGRFGVSGSTTSGTTIQSLVAFPGVATSGDQLWDAVSVYPTETPTTSQAFLLQWNESGAAYYFHGCVCTGIKFSFPVGRPATCTMTYKAAVVTGPTTATFPSVATLEDCLFSPVMNGLVFYQSAGTTTHATVCPSEIDLSIDLGTHFNRTICGTGAYQTITGWSRTKCVPTLMLKFPTWVNTYNTLFALDGTASVPKHIMVQNNCDATGRRFGFYLPYAHIVSPEPFVDDAEGQTGTSVSFIGAENVSPNNATDIAKSAIRFAFA